MYRPRDFKWIFNSTAKLYTNVQVNLEIWLVRKFWFDFYNSSLDSIAGYNSNLYNVLDWIKYIVYGNS